MPYSNDYKLDPHLLLMLDNPQRSFPEFGYNPEKGDGSVCVRIGIASVPESPLPGGSYTGRVPLYRVKELTYRPWITHIEAVKAIQDLNNSPTPILF